MAEQISARFGAVLAALSLAALPQPVSAQSLEELDQLVLASTKPKDGLALAQSQASEGALLEALSTLERVLTVEPKNKAAKLLHASLRCRVDDAEGASVEFARLKAKDYKKDDWAAARAPCVANGGAL